MTIKFSNNTVGVWYVQLPNSNWLASVWTENGETRLTYRFRYYTDDKSFDSNDQKNWYELKSNAETSDTLVEIIRTLARGMATIAGTEVYELMRADFDSLNDFMDEFAKAPFVEVQAELFY